MFDEAAHPRGEAGSATGGQFVAASSSSSSSSSRKARLKAGRGGAMSYNAKTGKGTGYGTPGGDARVKKLQALLNKLGLKDANGKPLAVDGKLGPLTTQAIKAAQRKYGLKPNGVVTPDLVSKLRAGKPGAKGKGGRLARPKAPLRRPAAKKPAEKGPTARQRSIAQKQARFRAAAGANADQGATERAQSRRAASFRGSS